MQATYSPINFNGRLGDSLNAKKESLQLKKAHLQAQQDAQTTYETEVSTRRNEVGDLFITASELRQDGEAISRGLRADAKGEYKSNKFDANIDFLKGFVDAGNTLCEARQQTKKLVASIQEVADDSKQLAKQAKADLAAISKTAKPLRQAAEKLVGSAVKESEEVSGSAAQAQKALKGASEAVTKALEEVRTLETQQRELETQYRQAVVDNKAKAKATKKGQFKDQDAKFQARFAELKETRAEALDSAKNAYEKAVSSAKQVLTDYKDQAGHNTDKAKELESKINSMERQVLKIKVQAYITRATNLPNLAAATIGLGAMGEGATKTIVDFTLSLLKKARPLKTTSEELAAISAAQMFLTEGSNNQKTIMATGIEMNAEKITANAPEDTKVIDGLIRLDELVDSTKQA